MTKEELQADLKKANELIAKLETQIDDLKAQVEAGGEGAQLLAELEAAFVKLWDEKVEVDGLLAGALEFMPKPKAPVVPEQPMKQCKGSFSWWPDTEEHFPDGGDYCAEFLNKPKVAEPVKQTGPVRKAAPDRILKAAAMK